MSSEHGLHVMLSYHWDNKDLVSKVYKGLKLKKIPVWMDIHGGISFNLFQSMADGVENAAVVCCFMTPKYQNSRNCEKELLYAERRRVSIIPCRLTRDWEPSTWLGIVTAGLVWIDFRDTTDTNLDLKIDKLIDQIRVVAGIKLNCFLSSLIVHSTSITDTSAHPPEDKDEQKENSQPLATKNSLPDSVDLSSLIINNEKKRNGIVIDYSKFRRLPRIIGNNNDKISFNCPSGVAISKTGLIYIADQQNQCVKVIPLLRSEQQILSRQFNRPKGIHIDEYGRILLTEHHRLLILDHELNILKSIGDHGSKPGEFNVPWGVATDSSSNIYVCDQMNNRIQKFDTDGKFLLEWGYEGEHHGQFYYPHFISISNNRVVVSDQLNHRIQVFDCFGNYHYKLGEYGNQPGQFSCPFGVCTDANDHIIVADHDNNRIQFFDADGDIQLVLDKEANPILNFQGVHGLTLTHDGGLIITDYKTNGTHRLFIFA